MTAGSIGELTLLNRLIRLDYGYGKRRGTHIDTAKHVSLRGLG
jgi:hypothetical protein